MPPVDGVAELIPANFARGGAVAREGSGGKATRRPNDFWVIFVLSGYRPDDRTAVLAKP